MSKHGAALVVSARGLRTPSRATAVGLRGVDLDVEAGTLTVLLGPSGEGSLDLLLLLAGRVEPTDGAIQVLGVDHAWVGRAEWHHWCDWASGHVGQAIGPAELLSYLTVGENLDLSPRRSSERSALAGLGWSHLAPRLPAHLTLPERWGVGLARVLSADFDLTLVDAPQEADAASIAAVAAFLRDLVVTKGRTVVLRVDRLDPTLGADQVVVVDDGVAKPAAEPAPEPAAGAGDDADPGRPT